jgi:hypothetical protein
MTASLVLLPLLLPESSVATMTKGKGKKRSYFKPTMAESMAWFVDIQKVGSKAEIEVNFVLYSVLLTWWA